MGRLARNDTRLFDLTSGTAFVLRRALKAKGLEYPRDYKLLSVGGTAPSFAALKAGQISAAMQAVPYAFLAQEAGFNVIGRIADVLPNYLLSACSRDANRLGRSGPSGRNEEITWV